jgi:uncharacterized protein
MSTATIYAHTHGAPNDDVTGVIGGSEEGVPGYWAFSVDSAQAWERRAAGGGTPIGLPATRWMAELGALAIRTDTELLLKSRRVIPARLPAAGFEFQHGSWPDAARDLVRRAGNRPAPR